MSHAHLNCWFKPDGTEIWLNDAPATEEFARENGFIRKIVGKRDPAKIIFEESAKDVDE